jgi:hypothetical protein
MGAIGNTAHDRRGANNGRASLMEAEVIRIRELASNGMPIENIRPSIGRVDLKWDSIFNAAVGVTWSLIGGAVDPKSLKHATHHGMRSAPEYTSWTGMRARCTNPNVPEFKNYGGRGISVCDRWMNGDGKLSGFECFLSDMGKSLRAGIRLIGIPTMMGITNRGTVVGRLAWSKIKTGGNLPL